MILALPTLLIARQPDLGTALLVTASGFFVIFLAGLSWKVIIGLMFVFVVLYLPRGLAGVAKDVLEWILARRRGSSEAPAVAAGE